LTHGTQMPAATADYLARHPGGKRTALGGPAAAADPRATAIVGTDRYETAAKVAAAFFNGPSAIGISSGADFPDALAGGPHIGRLGGPMLLTKTAELPPVVVAYLGAHRASISRSYVYGGTNAVTENVRTAISNAIG